MQSHDDSHLGRGLAPSHQDVDWDNDATTSFRRDDPRWASDEPSWSGNLSSLLEPDAFPELRPPEQHGSILDASPPMAARSEPLRRARQSLVSSAPLALDEPQLAIEGSLARSMRPRHSPWTRSLYFLVPMFVVLGIGLYWDPRGNHFDFNDAPWMPTPTPRTLARGLPATTPKPEAVQLAPEPVPEPGSATGAIMPSPQLPDDQELAALEAFDEPAQSLVEPAAPEVKQTPAPAKRLTKAQARRLRREARRARRVEFARPIMPMPDATPDEEDAVASGAAANQGILQINSRPWSRVIVDGKFVGHTPQRGLKLAPGKHRIRLENEPLDMSKIFDVVITSGRTVTRVEMLEENGTTESASQRN